MRLRASRDTARILEVARLQLRQVVRLEFARDPEAALVEERERHDGLGLRGATSAAAHEWTRRLRSLPSARLLLLR